MQLFLHFHCGELDCSPDPLTSIISEIYEAALSFLGQHILPKSCNESMTCVSPAEMGVTKRAAWLTVSLVLWCSESSWSARGHMSQKSGP